jgi:K+-sensing histidine kinase KdpD
VVAAPRWTVLVLAGKNDGLVATARKQVNSDQPSLPGDDDLRGLWMRRTTRTILLRYGEAVVFTALAVLLRWLLDPWLGDHLPLATLYGAVALAVWIGGYRPAILAAVLSFLVCTLLFVEPRAALAVDSAHTFVGLILCLSSFPIIAGLFEAMHAGPCFSEPPRRNPEQEVKECMRAGRGYTRNTLPRLVVA